MSKIITRSFWIILIGVIAFGCRNSAESKHTMVKVDSEKVDSVRLVIDSLSKAIRNNPYRDTLFYQRSHYFLLAGNIVRAVNDMEVAIKLKPDVVDYHLELANLELNRGESRIAKELLDRAHDRFPENIEVMVRLANIYMAIGQYKEARTKLILASRIEPRNPNLYMLSSIIFTEIGDDARAIEELQKAVMYEPEFYDGHVMLGVINARLGKAIAIDHYENAIRLQPDNPEPLYNLGMYYQENEMYDKALEVYQKGLTQIDSRMQHFLFNQGFIYERFRGNYDTAIVFYDSVIQYHPDDYRAFYRKGICLENMGQVEKAMAAYDMALKINPKFEDAYDALSHLSKVRKQKK